MAEKPKITSYSDYLMLEKLLDSQKPHSLIHDEILFIVIHQTKELWLYQIVKELSRTREFITKDEFHRASESLIRVPRIISVMTLSWDVLATMPADEFLKFRDMFDGASGLQSAQFRELEFLLGIREGVVANVGRQREGSKARQALENELAKPSLWDEMNRALVRARLPNSSTILERKKLDRPYKPQTSVEDAWAQVYGDTDRWWPLYRLGERFLDVASALHNWRSKHILTVERIIGNRKGTGGTPGVGYLVQTMTRRAFPELWNLRNRD